MSQVPQQSVGVDSGPRQPLARSQRLGRRAFGGIVGVALVGLLAACASQQPAFVPSDEGVEAAVTVTVIDNKYEPAQVEVKPGQAVRWVFAGSMEHDVVAADGSFVSELQTSGEYVHVFDEAGEFPYDCSIHPEMTGIVSVR